MNDRFADTGFYVATGNPRDSLYARAVAVSTGFSGRVVTTEFVLVEVATFCVGPTGRQRFIDLVAALRADPTVDLIPASNDLFQRGHHLFAARLDKDWSLTDCISFVVMKDHGLTDALTADHHFEQAGFNALLK